MEEEIVDRKRDLVFVLSFFIVASFIILPVLAGMQSYNDDEPTVTYGDWDVDDYDANEEWLFTGYLCEFEFVYTGVRTDGYDYKINLEYDGCSPWMFWSYETLRGEYKWGSSGTWKVFALLDWITFSGDITIDDASSSTLYIRFKDTQRNPDNTLHYWYFSDTPVLKVWY
jgi:hypothetical protein